MNLDVHTVATVGYGLASLAVGWAGQHFFKSRPDVSTTATHAIVGLVAFGFYALANPFPNCDPGQWILAGFSWAGAVIGAGSTLAGAGLAAKTDSR